MRPIECEGQKSHRIIDENLSGINFRRIDEGLPFSFGFEELSRLFGARTPKNIMEIAITRK